MRLPAAIALMIAASLRAGTAAAAETNARLAQIHGSPSRRRQERWLELRRAAAW